MNKIDFTSLKLAIVKGEFLLPFQPLYQNTLYEIYLNSSGDCYKPYIF